MLRVGLGLISALVVAGCQTSGGLPAAADQNSGRLPAANAEEQVPRNYRQTIREKVRETVKDPYSIRSASISRPKMGFTGLIYGGQQPVVCVQFNAKNSYGAYTGIETFFFMFSNGHFTEMKPEFAACRDAVYEPFPELEQIT